jgi:phosphate uptake regulator
MRTGYIEELKKVQSGVMAMGALVEDTLTQANKTLKHRDFEASKCLVKADAQINEKRFEIGDSAIGILPTQQPTVGDLR